MLSAQWLNNSSELQARLAGAVEPVVQRMAQPASQRRLRQLLLLLFALWAVFALARMIWALVPQSDAVASAPAKIINPVTSRGPVEGRQQLDIEKMRDWHLFGEAGAAPEVAEVPKEATNRDGWEDRARDTRLALKLRGIVASTEDGLGHAIIEHRNQQAVYAVDDKLPVSGRVTLAKVMREQVIIDNGGTYERLKLFDKSELKTTAVLQSPGKIERDKAASQPVDTHAQGEASALAQDFRKRLYEDPTSLSKVVSVSAVRENGSLQGYRVSPGREREAFQQLGFKPGDLVTGVNGVSLENPANTMKLYGMLRTAEEVVFELKRNGQPMTLSVSLDDAAQ